MPICRSAVLSAVCAAVACAGEPVPARTTIVVRADARSGRLIRSVVIAPKVISFETETAAAPEQDRTAPAGNLAGMIDAIALKNDVEGPLVHSVIKAESNYNPLAVSPKGARGLMQLIPSTAKRFGVADSFNPQENIEGGVKYLKFLMDLYRNDYVKVIAAYNAGEGAVNKYGGIPPYAETRNYVLQVGKNLKNARTLAAAKSVVAKTEPAKSETAAEPKFRPIVAVTGEDGRVYYKTQ